MRRPRYPLEPLAEIRRRKVETAAELLGDAKRRHDVAEHEARATECKQRDHEAATQRLRCDETTALERGDLHVADLARRDAWEVRVAGEQSALKSEVQRARGVESSAQAHEEGARRDLVRRATDERVILRDRARWTEVQRKGAEAREEEASSEAWRPTKQ